MTTKDTVLVLGGTGKTGRRVAQRLEARGVPVRIGSRSAEPPFDWEDRSTWAPALEGMSAAYVSYYPDLAIPGAVEAVGAFARLAVERGVRRLVLLSGRGEAEAEQAERAVQASGADLTIVRATWFAQNFSEDYMLRRRAGRRGRAAGGGHARAVRRRGRHRRRGRRGADRGRARRRALRADRPARADVRRRGRRRSPRPPAARSPTSRSRSTSSRPRRPRRASPPTSSACSRYLFGEVLDGRNSHDDRRRAARPRARAQGLRRLRPRRRGDRRLERGGIFLT